MRGRAAKERQTLRLGLVPAEIARAFLRGFCVGQNSLLLGAALARGEGSIAELLAMMRTAREGNCKNRKPKKLGHGKRR